MKFSAILASVSAAAQAATLTPRDDRPISVPTTKPVDAIVVPKNFVGFGIESAFFTAFNNNFSSNLVTALADRMGAPPVIRVGGTGGDYLKFNPDQKEAAVCREGERDAECGSHLAGYTLGPSFFDTFRDRFKNARFIVQAPLNNPVNMTNSLAYVTKAWEALGGGDRVEAIALGNEVEFIYKGGQADAYVKAALEIQDSIVKKLGLGGETAAIFEAGNTASGSVKSPNDPERPSYKVDDILDAGINENKRISTTAEHLYQVMNTKLDWTDETMQSRMINHTAITQRFKKYEPSLKASLDRGINYAITEGAAVLGGAPVEFSGGFAYTLWAADFNLLAMSRGVSRVANLAGRPGARRVFWSPDESGGEASPGPHARAPFPAAIFVADFLGKEGTPAVKELDTKSDLMGAYAMYGGENGNLQRVAIVNMRLYNGTTDRERGEDTFKVEVGDEVGSVRVQRLRADKGVAAMGFDFGGAESNVSWAGEQWSFKVNEGKGHFLGDRKEEERVEVKDGIASVVVPDSEAVIVFVE